YAANRWIMPSKRCSGADEKQPVAVSGARRTRRGRTVAQVAEPDLARGSGAAGDGALVLGLGGRAAVNGRVAAHGRPEGVADDERADRLRRRRAAQRGAESGRPGAGAATRRNQRRYRGCGECRHSAGGCGGWGGGGGAVRVRGGGWPG